MPYYIGDLKRDPNLENHPHVKLGLGPLMQKHVHATPTCDVCLLIFACTGVGLCCGKMYFAINVVGNFPVFLYRLFAFRPVLALQLSESSCDHRLRG